MTRISRINQKGALLFFAAVLAACAPHTAATPSSVPPLLARAEQLVVVTTPDWDSTSGTLRRFERSSVRGEWRRVGASVPIVVGRTGLAWGHVFDALASGEDPHKREGDGRSPAGVFPLDTAFGFAPRDSARWVRLPYVQLTPTVDCVDDTASVHYNTVVDRASVVPIDWSSAERMRQVGQYRIGVIVGYNATPPTRGRGSCIFLHIWAGPQSTTSGCTALDAEELRALMAWLDPSKQPAIVQFPAREYARRRTAWRLPEL